MSAVFLFSSPGLSVLCIRVYSSKPFTLFNPTLSVLLKGKSRVGQVYKVNVLHLRGAFFRTSIGSPLQKPPIHPLRRAHTHRMVGCCLAKRCRALREQFRVRRLAQRHSDVQTLGAGIQTAVVGRPCSAKLALFSHSKRT